MSAAGTNVAAVHYHFGSKDALVTALIAERSHEISARRAVLLDALEQAEQFTARELASAFVVPVVETTQAGGEAWVRFVATLINSTHPAMSQVTQGFFEQGRRFIALTERLHPDWPSARLVFRLSQAMTATFNVLGDIPGVQRTVAVTNTELSRADVVEQLLDWIAATLTDG